MGKLTDSQLIVLAAAAARDDGAASVPARMNKAAASKVASSLVTRKLMREIKAKPDMPVWREDEDARRYSLVITAAGRKAIGVEDEGEEGVAATSPVNGRGKRKAGAEPLVAGQAKPFREGSKQALLVKMLSAKNGASLPAMEDATGWLPHTMRAALTGLRKKGFVLTRDRQPGKNSVYKIADSVTAASA